MMVLPLSVLPLRQLILKEPPDLSFLRRRVQQPRVPQAQARLLVLDWLHQLRFSHFPFPRRFQLPMSPVDPTARLPPQEATSAEKVPLQTSSTPLLHPSEDLPHSQGAPSAPSPCAIDDKWSYN